MADRAERATMTYHSATLSNGVRLAYLDEGAGEPHFLIHGFTGTALSHCGSLVQEFRPTYRVIAPDLPGYGASRPPNRTFPPDFYQRDALAVAALLDELACSPCRVLGFSDGAEVALLLAAARPDLVAGVVAWGVSGVISAEMLAAVERWLPLEGWGPERAAWRASIVARHGPEQLSPLISGWVEAARAIVAAGGNICLEQAAAIKGPVLLINGELEVGNTPANVARLAARISDCRLEFVPQSSHAVHDEQPEQFMALVRPFLARCL
jgi:valacyclovir hydrolase